MSKRYTRKRHNGKREYRWALRREGPDGWRFEATGPADRTHTEAVRKQKMGRVEHSGM